MKYAIKEAERVMKKTNSWSAKKKVQIISDSRHGDSVVSFLLLRLTKIQQSWLLDNIITEQLLLLNNRSSDHIKYCCYMCSFLRRLFLVLSYHHSQSSSKKKQNTTHLCVCTHVHPRCHTETPFVRKQVIQIFTKRGSRKAIDGGIDLCEIKQQKTHLNF